MTSTTMSNATPARSYLPVRDNTYTERFQAQVNFLKGEKEADRVSNLHWHEASGTISYTQSSGGLVVVGVPFQTLITTRAGKQIELPASQLLCAPPLEEKDVSEFPLDAHTVRFQPSFPGRLILRVYWNPNLGRWALATRDRGFADRLLMPGFDHKDAGCPTVGDVFYRALGDAPMRTLSDSLDRRYTYTFLVRAWKVVEGGVSGPLLTDIRLAHARHNSFGSPVQLPHVLEAKDLLRGWMREWLLQTVVDPEELVGETGAQTAVAIDWSTGTWTPVGLRMVEAQ